MMAVIEYVGLGIGLLGGVVIVWGVLLATLDLVRLEFSRLRVSGAEICGRRECIRQHLGSYLLLGLEIMVAADIVAMIERAGWHEIGILGAIVGIRTVLSYFLTREYAGHSCGTHQG
jgi:uncharacterized membrane protein